MVYCYNMTLSVGVLSTQNSCNGQVSEHSRASNSALTRTGAGHYYPHASAGSQLLLKGSFLASTSFHLTF